MIRSLLDSRYDGRWVTIPYKDIFKAIATLHYIFWLMILGLLGFYIFDQASINELLPKLLVTIVFYVLVVGYLTLSNRRKYILSPEGEKQKRDSSSGIDFMDRKFVRYPAAVFCIWIGIWLWGTGNDAKTVFGSLGFFFVALLLAREIGVIVLGLVVIGLVIWGFSLLPAIPMAIIIGALIIAAAIKGNK